MSNTGTWLWPNRTIGKRESGELRDEHNALVNRHAEVLVALRRMIPDFVFGIESDTWGDRSIEGEVSGIVLQTDDIEAALELVRPKH